MPFLTPGSRMSMAPRAPPVNFPASPLQSECESVTPRSQPYPSTPPVLDADIFDTVPFSASFSAFLNLSTQDGILRSPAITAGTTLAPIRGAKRLSSQAEASYYVEQLTNIRDVDSEWEDDEVEEVMIISPKPKASPAPHGSFLANALPTPPFSPPIESPSHVTPKESYTILRTLHRTQTSYLSLAVSSGCTPSTKKSALRHALYAIRTYRMPLSRGALAERAALEVLSARERWGNPYVQRASRFWDDGQTLFIVLEHCGGGNLMGLIQAEGPVDGARMKRWACEIASGISFIHGAGIIHSDLRPTTILFRVNGHVCISGFEHAIVIATRPNVPPSIEERQRGTVPSAREWCEAPEMLLGWEIGLEVDCWAFGIILIWMITGKHPWYYSTREFPSIIRDCILNGILPVASLEEVDTAIEHLITKCLDRNPCKRPTIEQIKAFGWFANIDWENICLARVPDIQITLPTPDMTPDLPGDMPSTIIAPDLSLSTVDTETEIERSLLPWTPARISRPVDLVSPGAATIASGQSAVLSHGNGAPLFPGRPRNPSPPSLPGSTTGGGDTFTPRLHKGPKDVEFHESFLPELSEVDGIVQVDLGICVDEFGTFLSENEPHEVAKHPDLDSSGSPEISLRDALALPIPLLVTPRASEIDLRVVRSPGTPTPTTSRLPARLFRWGNSSSTSSPGASITRDVATANVNALYERERGLPELSWHGLDADPFRCSPALSVPREVRDAGDDGEAVAGSRRMDATFRWSSASVETEGPPYATGHGHGHEHEHERSHAMSFAGLGALTRRIRDQGRALLRKSRSSVFFPRARIAAGSSPPLPNLLHPPLGNTAVLEGDGLGGSMRRIGLGIGYSLPNPGSTAVPAQQAHGNFATAHRREGREGTVPASCYAGLGGGGRRKKGTVAAAAALATAQQQRQRQSLGEQRRDNLGAAGAATAADSRLACAPTSGASPCDSGCVLILGNPGFGGAAAVPAATSTPNVHQSGSERKVSPLDEFSGSGPF